MKVLITGAGGFIGSHLTELCVETGYDVRAMVHYNSLGSWGWLEGSTVSKHVEVVSGDIRDYDSVHEALKGVDTVFHLAALIGIPYSYVSPQAFIRTNVEGTYNVLQSAMHWRTENVLVTSTSETYGSAQYIPIDEKHPAVGQSPYAATKIGADQLALSFHKSFDLPVKVVRPFNTYGPRQSARAIIPTVLGKILSGQTRLELGNLNATRDLTYVHDTVSGFLEIAKNNEFAGEATNIGTGKEVSIRDLVSIIGEECDVEIDIVVDPKRIRPENSEVERLFCDASKLMKLSNWKPTHDLRQGIRKTADWMRQNLSFYKPDRYSI